MKKNLILNGFMLMAIQLSAMELGPLGRVASTSSSGSDISDGEDDIPKYEIPESLKAMLPPLPTYTEQGTQTDGIELYAAALHNTAPEEPSHCDFESLDIRLRRFSQATKYFEEVRETALTAKKNFEATWLENQTMSILFNSVFFGGGLWLLGGRTAGGIGLSLAIPLAVLDSYSSKEKENLEKKRNKAKIALRTAMYQFDSLNNYCSRTIENLISPHLKKTTPPRTAILASLVATHKAITFLKDNKESFDDFEERKTPSDGLAGKVKQALDCFEQNCKKMPFDEVISDAHKRSQDLLNRLLLCDFRFLEGDCKNPAPYFITKEAQNLRIASLELQKRITCFSAPLTKSHPKHMDHCTVLKSRPLSEIRDAIDGFENEVRKLELWKPQ